MQTFWLKATSVQGKYTTITTRHTWLTHCFYSWMNLEWMRGKKLCVWRRRHDVYKIFPARKTYSLSQSMNENSFAVSSCLSCGSQVRTTTDTTLTKFSRERETKSRGRICMIVKDDWKRNEEPENISLVRETCNDEKPNSAEGNERKKESCKFFTFLLRTKSVRNNEAAERLTVSSKSCKH